MAVSGMYVLLYKALQLHTFSTQSYRPINT